MSLEKILALVTQNRLLYAVLSSPNKKFGDQVEKTTIRPLLIKGKPCYQISDHCRQKVLHQNLSPDECQLLVHERLLQSFKQGVFFTAEADYHVLVNRTKNLTILTKPPTKKTILPTHDRKKMHILQEGTPVPFLIALGIMGPEGKVKATKYAKFRQINRFLEFVRDILPYLKGKKKIHIVDYGCGKAYLTFAIYHYLHMMEGYELDINGLDLKSEVIDHCSDLAQQLGYRHLHFAVGDISQHQPKAKVDMVITLHACNTATDAALEKAVRWDADIILSVPCCQHELYHQIKNSELNSLLEHGILKERFAALATDAARAQILEVLGYDTQIIEFIDLEHTPKNLLIRAIKSSKARPLSSLKKYMTFKSALNIFPSLEQRFQKELQILQGIQKDS